MATKRDAQEEGEDGNHQQKHRVRAKADPSWLARHAPIGCPEFGTGFFLRRVMRRPPVAALRTRQSVIGNLDAAFGTRDDHQSPSCPNYAE
jgi:hypothetical protein